YSALDAAISGLRGIQWDVRPSGNARSGRSGVQSHWNTMDRRAELVRFIDRDQVGIEIGPWHTPLAPKRDGYQSISIDVFDVDTLRRRAVADPNIDEAGVARIEDVDLIGPAQEIAELAAARFGPSFTCD